MDAEIYFNSGVQKSKSGDLTGAIEDYTKVIELTTFSERKTITTQHADGSVEHVDVIETSEGNGDAYYNRACAYFDIGLYDAAVHDFSKVIEQAPNDGDLYFKRATAYYCLNRDSEAIADLGKAIALNPQYTKELFYSQFGH